jgi:aldehyde dehydrogenase (NAD+)
LCVATLTEIFEEAGLPPGVLNVVSGYGDPVGIEIVENPRIKAISFTGGVPTGRDVYQRAAKLLKPVELELGGKNPVIVMDDANIDLVVEGVLFGAFGTSGQRCTATSRLIIHEKVYNEVLDRLVARVNDFTVGNPLECETDMGPVVDEQQRDNILNYIEIGTQEANLVTGGKRLTGGLYDRGHYIAPTIFETKHGSCISKEEIFGPVLSVMKISDFDEAIRIANDVDYGLSSSIYTRDVNLAFRAIEELETGITYINAPTIGAEVHLPFGGTKNTGNGGREAGTTAIDEFSEIKTVFIDYSNRLQKAQIQDCGE